ncbi:MAG: signal peptidase II [Firmicutes bacterium]|nr:signal peptidase II [Bacillota bacterium]NLL88502.1 signal peptidase II [Bacillota bacterium]HKM16724.1 signal peptidase II [Limnochordia bacterium]
MIYVITCASIVMIDQLSKHLISTNFVEGESVRLLPYLYLTYVKNVGAAFGLFANWRWVFIILGIAVVVAAFYFRELIKRQSWYVRWGVTLAIGGAIGNLIDRIRIGAVIDFIDVTFFSIFNLADISIVAGVALLFLEVLINDRKAASR